MGEVHDDEAIKPEETKDRKKKPGKEKQDLPYCTTAPSAEHHRAADEDEPCDDGRGGNV